MQRRKYLHGLLVTGTLAVAGCTSDETTEEEQTEATPTEEDQDTDNDEESNEVTETDGDETEEDEADEEETNGNGRPDMVNHGHEIVENPENNPSIAVDYEVENAGDGDAYFLETVVDWYDDEGEYIDTDSETIWLLRGGETWRAQIPAYSLSGEEDRIEDYEISGSFDEQGLSEPPEGVEATESELLVGEDSAEVRGTVVNNSESTVEFLDVIPRVFDADGNHLQDTYDNVENFEPGDEVSINLSLFAMNSRYQEMDSVELHLAT